MTIYGWIGLRHDEPRIFFGDEAELPELHLYQTEGDELEVIKEALAAGCWIVPDSDFETPEARRLESLDEFQEARLSERHFFILHERFQRLPLQLRQISKNGNTVFYVSPSQGGPFLEFLGGGIVEDEKSRTRHIRSGFLAYSSGYWNADNTKKEPSPPELAEAFRRLAKVIRTSSIRIKPDKSVYWLGNNAKAQLLAGAKLGLHEDWTPVRA